MRIVTARAVDDSLGTTDLLELALSARGVTPGTSTSSPPRCWAPGWRGGERGLPRPGRRARMWGYLNSDTLGQNAAEFADEALPDVPR